MTHVIWKYQLKVEDEQILHLPTGAVCLSVQAQHGAPVVWAHVDPDDDEEDVTFFIIGTGHSMPEDDDLEYLGTFQMLNGAYVGHVFYKGDG